MPGFSNRMSWSALSLIALAGVLLALCPAGAWAQKATNVDCDKCVDTGDIAKKAVEKKQLAKDSITSNRIADGTIKAKDLADGVIDESKLDMGAVTSGKLADGAVTADKLAPDAVFGRIILVRAEPLDTVGNCDALQDALAGITDNDADNRYLIHLAPGIYDCGAMTVQMKAFVDIEGEGRDVTHITGSVPGSNAGLVVGADNTELRYLSVENADIATDLSNAIYTAADSFRITDVSAVARNSESVRAIVLDDGTAVLTDVTLEALDPTTGSARAIRVHGDSILELVNVVVIATDGPSSVDSNLDVANGGGALGSATVTARNSVFRGGVGLFIDQGSTGRFVSSQLDSATRGGGDVFCVGAYDGSFAPLDGSCD